MQSAIPAELAVSNDKFLATQRLSSDLSFSADVTPVQNLLNVSHVNINSITAPNRLDELEQFANSNDIHVLCTTETKLDETISQTLYTMQSFRTPFTKHRTRRGGGVAIFIRKNIACTRILELELEGIEWVWVKIRTNREIVMVCCIYRVRHKFCPLQKHGLNVDI